MDKESLRGVYKSTKKDGSIYYRSSITHQNKHISLGSFSTPEKAHQAYWEAALILMGKSKSLKNYDKNCILSYKKWVILINFRDNNIYLSHPIYLKASYFEYHLNEDTILKFSTDDLFYYSHKQIMQRGRHFFVADFGMQVNILNRYGIKNYAVEGRDFIFKNNDIYDFRYENIEIINTFHGVTIENKNNKTLYIAKIHIKGNYTIGKYENAIEAAIAYNKAIDILMNNGITKKFTPNYIEEISAYEYANIYSKISISSKIHNYRVE